MAIETQQKATLFQSVSLAGVAAVITVNFVHPIDTIKTRLQIAGEAGRQTAQYKGSLSAIKIIAQEGGVSAFYKGIQAAWLRESVYTSLRLGLYEPIKDITGSKTLLQKFVAGSLAGAIGSVAGNPFDVLKTRMMASEGQANSGFVHHVNDILSHQGIKGFYRGISTNVTRAMVLNATKMGIYDSSKDIVKKQLGIQDGLSLQFICASIAGFFMAITVTPFDMARTRIMNQPKNLVLYTGMIDCFLKITKSEGPLSVYKGFFPVWARFAPTTTLQLVIFEQLRTASGIKGL